MKILRKILTVFFAACIVLSIPVSGFSERASTTYKVRIYPGVQAGFNNDTKDKNPIELYLPYNGAQTINLAAYGIKLSETVPDTDPVEYRYTVIGLREAGKGTGTFNAIERPISITSSGIITIPQVTHDTDYVVAYSIGPSTTEYTVQYLEEGTGRDLLSLVARTEDESDEDLTHFVGVRGTKIRVAPRYVEGYSPVRAGGTAKTLSGKASENVFPIYYTRNATGTTGGATITNVTTGGGGVAAGNANANANTATANANANSIYPQAGYQMSEDILDLDVPLAEFEGPAASVAPVLVPFADVNGDTAQRRLPNWMTIGLIVVLAGLIAALYWYLLFYRKKKKYANEVDYDFSFLDDDDHDDYR